MDISDTLAPKSDQLDAVDLLGGPRVFTITGVTEGKTPEQPIQVHLDGFPRTWRPNVTMRRLMFKIWRPAVWGDIVGRIVELYNDETVTFGKEKTGGIRIKALSGISKPQSVTLPVSQGRFGTFTVQPLTDPTPADRVAALRAEWKTATAERKTQIEALVAELGAES